MSKAMAYPKPAKLIVKQPEPPAEEITTSILAEAIVAISDGMKALLTGPLNEKALLLLIQHAMPVKGRVTTAQIKAVLEATENLKSMYLKR